jgi:Protein of unknown function (DUF1214)
MDRRELIGLSSAAFAAGFLGSPSAHTATASTAGYAAFIDYFRDADALAVELGFDDASLRAAYRRQVMMVLSGAYIQVFGTRLENPQLVPYIADFMPYIAPNPDTVYGFAPIDPAGTYRLRGQNGTESVSTITVRDGGAHLGRISGNRVDEIDLHGVRADADGRFSFLMSAHRPADSAEPWLPLHPQAHCFSTRRVIKEKSQRDGWLGIERLDGAAAALVHTKDSIDAQFATMAANALAVLRDSMTWTKGLREKGAHMTFQLQDQSAYGGLRAQSYFFNTFEFGEGEALLAECNHPKAKYWSLQLLDPFSTALDFVHHQASLNDAQAVTDSDGRLRIVIAPTDPGIANWLDTGGWHKGGMIWRWNDTSEAPQPTLRKVRVSELDALLPKDVRRLNAIQRKAALGERASFYQSRRRY